MTPSDQIVNPQRESYQPPAIEKILTADDLEREVLYAGQIITTDFT